MKIDRIIRLLWYVCMYVCVSARVCACAHQQRDIELLHELNRRPRCECVCVCGHVCMCACVHVRMCACVRVCVCAYEPHRRPAYARVCAHTCVSACACVRVCPPVLKVVVFGYSHHMRHPRLMRVRVCACVCVYVYVYVRI